MAKHILDALAKWSQKEEWDELFGDVLDMHFGAVCDDRDVDFDELAELIGDDAFAALWTCAFEDFLTQPRSEENDATIIDDYLRRRGWKESATAKRYLEALKDSMMSFYEASDIVPGQSMRLRDLLLGGDPVLVTEQSATQALKPWDRIAARVVQVSGQYRLTGSLLLFEHQAAAALLEEFEAEKKRFRREFKKQAKAARLEPLGLGGAETADLAFLSGAAPLFTHVWLDHALSRVLDDTHPTLLNADGDELSFHTARFDFASGTTAPTLRARLDGLGELVAAGEGVWNWVEDPPADAVAKTSPKVHRLAGDSLHVDLEDGGKVLGNVELVDDALILETNSARRAALGSDMLKAALGPLLGRPQVTRRNLDEVRTEVAERGENVSESSLPDGEQEAAARRIIDSHYRAALDQSLPMLDGKTPRAAAKTKTGQRNVAEWLKYLENQTARAADASGTRAYDFAWMWEELGIAHLRK